MSTSIAPSVPAAALRRALVACGLAIVGGLAAGAPDPASDAGPAVAEPAWPDRPIRLVVSFGAGGIADVVARLIATPLGHELGQPVVVENRVGGGGTVGAQFVARAEPDGHTLLVGTPATQVINPLIFRRLGYDAYRERIAAEQRLWAPLVTSARISADD